MMGNRGGRRSLYDRKESYRKQVQHMVKEGWTLTEMVTVLQRGRSNVWKDTLRARRDLGMETPPSNFCRRCGERPTHRVSGRLCLECKKEDAREEAFEGKN